VKKEDPKLVYFGPEEILNNFIIPNIGLDYPIYHLQSDIELVSKARVNKVLMQRYQNLQICTEA
jgi:hypothetical protein